MSKVGAVGGNIWSKRLRKIGPVIGAAVIVAAILHKVSARDIGASMRDGNTLAIVPFAVGLSIVYLVCAATADFLVLRRFEGPPYFDVLRGKAAAAVLTVVGYV